MARSLAARKRGLMAAALAAAIALAALALLASGLQLRSAGARPGELLSFVEFRQKCLDACKIKKAHDVKGRLKIMAKCESSELSHRFISYQKDCTKNPGKCAIPVMGCGGEYRPEMLA
jgi:hypothetical protein